MGIVEEYIQSQLDKAEYTYIVNDDMLTCKVLSLVPDDISLRYVLMHGNEKISYSYTTRETEYSFVIPSTGTYHVKLYFLSEDASISKILLPIEIELKEKKGDEKKYWAEVDYFEFGNKDFAQKYTRSQQELLLGINNGAYYSFRPNMDVYFMTGNIEGVDISLPFSWDFSAVNDRKIPYNVHAFLYQASLLVMYWKTSSRKYRDKYIAYVFDWIDKHQQVDMNDVWAWHDDATARRTYFFITTLLMFEHLLSEEQIRKLEKSITMQIRLLCQEFFYKYHHNHGLYQDRAVALYGLALSNEPEYHLTVAKERMKEYLNFAFTEEGVHKEHSPMYHMDMARSVEWFYRAYEKEDEAFAGFLNNLLRKMSEYCVWICMPNGEYPSIGDSAKKSRFIPSWNDENYQYIITKGSEGQPPKNNAKVFWEAGYGVIRSNWCMNSSATWMMLLAATHSQAHKHNDDLSFLLYHKGELFVEAGNRNYNYAEPMTQYVYSSYAHNVLFVDGQGWKLKENFIPYLEPEAFNTHILDACVEGDNLWVTGVQTRFPGVRQERTLKFVSESNFAYVTDKIYLEKEKKIRVIYHLADGIQVEKSGETFLLKRKNSPVAKIVWKTNQEHVTHYIQGEREDEWKTWIFAGKVTPTCGSLFAVDMAGKSGENIIELAIELL